MDSDATEVDAITQAKHVAQDKWAEGIKNLQCDLSRAMTTTNCLETITCKDKLSNMYGKPAWAHHTWRTADLALAYIKRRHEESTSDLPDQPKLAASSNGIVTI